MNDVMASLDEYVPSVSQFIECAMRSIRSVLPLVAVGFACIGCGASKPAATTANQGTAISSTQSPAAPASDTNRTILITAHDYSYTGVPVHAPAGWLRMRMVNAGKELHMLAIADVPRGYTTATLIDSLLHNRAVGHMQNWGGVNATGPDDTSSVSVFLPAGDYVFGCFIQSADGKEHFNKGMLGSLHVVAAPDTGSRPSADAVVTLSDYHIGMTAGTIKRGTRTLRVRNTVDRGHDLLILKLLPGHSVAEALKWFEDPANGAPAAAAIGGVTALHKGEDAFVTAAFTPGTYVLICIMQTNGKPHFDLGMKEIVTVPAT